MVVVVWLRNVVLGKTVPEGAAEGELRRQMPSASRVIGVPLGYFAIEVEGKIQRQIQIQN